MSEESDVLGPWSVAVGDQLAAAVQDENWELCGELGVEGLMRAISIDCPDEVPSFHYFMTCLNGLGVEHLMLMGAQALRLVYEQRLRREQ